MHDTLEVSHHCLKSYTRCAIRTKINNVTFCDFYRNYLYRRDILNNFSEERLKQLMVSALGGDKSDYRILLQDIAKMLRVYFSRRVYINSGVETEDLIQDTLLALHTRRITYDRDLPFLPWVRGIARHKLVDYLRRSGRHQLVTLDDEMFSQDTSKAIDAKADVDRLLLTLPSRTSGLIRGVKIEGRSVEEMGQKFGMSSGAIKVAIHRGISALTKRTGTKNDG